jgi:uncharacterized protein (TIGR02231 family)
MKLESVKAWFLSLLILGLAAPAARAELTAVTAPKQVTVFPDGARVTREGSLSLPAGVNQVVFPDLPFTVVESSLRLTVDGPQGTKLYGVSLRNDYTPDVVEKRTRLLKDKLQALLDKKTDLSDQMDSRKAEMDLLKALADKGDKSARDQGPNRPTALLDFTASVKAVGGRLALLTALNRKDERSIRSLDDQITALEREISRRGSPSKEKRTAEADLELPEAGMAHFTLTYQVNQASWKPLYDLRLETEKDKPALSLDFNAGIRQTTGEDWTGVLLTLSTVRPAEGTQVPDPTNWWLDFVPRDFNQTRNFQSKYLSNSFGIDAQIRPEIAGIPAASAAAIPEPAPAQVVTAQTIQSAYAMDFSIPVRRDIPSDGTDHRVAIAQNFQTVDLNLVAVPRLSQAAYLEAHVTYGGEQALLPGDAQLFRNGDFVGTTQLASRSPGETFDLGFGQDEQVRVERRMEKNQEGAAGGFGDVNKGERQYRWVTTVANYHSGPQTIQVREQLPRSRQKDISVEQTQVSPKPLDEDTDKPGLLRWNLSLAPKEKAKITFGYKVKYPDNVRVTGLE